MLVKILWKQPLVVFFKKKSSWKFREIHRKTPVPESFFIKKETLAQVFSCEFLKIFKNTFFQENLRTTVSALQALGITFIESQ